MKKVYAPSLMQWSFLALFFWVCCDSPSYAGWTLQVKGNNGLSIRSLQGVNAGPYPSGDTGNKDLTAEYQGIGVNLIRTHDFYGPLDMAEMYPDRTKDPSSPASYNFTNSDIRFKAILDSGAEPYFRLGDSYNNVTPPSSSELDHWIQAAVYVIRHYRTGLWNGFNSKFRYVEIGNEPNNAQFWPSPYTMMDFYRMYAGTAKALREAFPDIKIGGPGWTHAVVLMPEEQKKLKDFLDYVQETKAPLDFMSWHIYSNKVSDYTTCARYFRNILDEWGFTATESHVTEWNNDSSDKETEATEWRVNAKGAAFDTAFWMELQKNAVDIATFYRGNDTSMKLKTFYGLFMADGTPKKAADVFSLWSDFTRYSDMIDVAGADGGDSSTLYWLGGQKNDQEMAILISNPSDSETSYSLIDAGQAYFNPTPASMTVDQVSDQASRIISFGATPEHIAIPAKSVQLVKWSNIPVIGKTTGVIEKQVPRDQWVQLWVNSTNARGDKPVAEWFLYTAIIGGTGYPVYVISDKGIYELNSILSSLTSYTFTFSSTGNTLIGTLRMSDLGMSSGDTLMYGYAYQSADMSIWTDNIVVLRIQ